jgi:mannose-6-phosphate isomerase-like protein (cupin superfamily)
MAGKIIYLNIKSIQPVLTNHKVGLKYVFADNTNCESNLTQAAFGYLREGEKAEEHCHPTMEEFYFFIEGSSLFHVGSEHYKCEEGTFIRIPSGIKHQLEAKSDCRFIYWGISI